MINRYNTTTWTILLRSLLMLDLLYLTIEDYVRKRLSYIIRPPANPYGATAARQKYGLFLEQPKKYTVLFKDYRFRNKEKAFPTTLSERLVSKGL